MNHDYEQYDHDNCIANFSWIILQYIFFVITAFKMVTNDEIEFGLEINLVAGFPVWLQRLKFVSNLTPPFYFYQHVNMI
jgi:hypothetical protein